KAIRAAPRSAKVHYNLAAHYYRFGRKQEAMDAAMRALDVDSQHPAGRRLVRLMEQERRPPARGGPASAPAARPFPGSAMAPEVAQPVTAAAEPARPAAESLQSPAAQWAPTVHRPADIRKPRHALPFIESLGAGWPVILWGLFAGQTASMLYLFQQSLMGSGLSDLPGDIFFGQGAGLLAAALMYMLFWFLWIVAWVTDLVHARPAPVVLTIAIAGLVGSLPFCLFMYSPLLSALLFPVYFLVSRGRRL
ncbi:MAG: tetratricopeptide repeat protein, partial [Armatimonadetes bacterium]|nr:tetratricopeptide repeat protein [Armatimonadota bacterium]